jgi:3-oxoacyl-[acyl-carrier-protein] synthase-3
MGARIKMVSVARPGIAFHHVNSINLSARAARQCLKDAGIDPLTIGFLVNTGIYRHKNTGEPAIAALIQKKIAACNPVNNDPGQSTSTFSFDINNGGCGLLTGIEIINLALCDNEITYGMLVTGDSEPFHGLSENFNIHPAAAALILEKSHNSNGFSLFRTYTFPEYSNEFVSRTFYNDLGWFSKGKTILNIKQKESWLENCVNCSVKSLFNFLDESGMSINETDLIIPSQNPSGFTGMLKKRLGLSDNFIEVEKDSKMIYHTAGPAFALKKVWDDKRFRDAKNIVFLTVGSGINVSLALYKN